MKMKMNVNAMPCITCYSLRGVVSRLGMHTQGMTVKMKIGI
jgi:hypothetical protein